MHKPIFDIHYFGDVSKHSNLALLTTLARERLDTYYSDYQHIYTDGSISALEEVGCAFTIPSKQVTETFHLNSGTSIFTAELYAIYMACCYVANQPSSPTRNLVISDSLSSLQALAGRGNQNRKHLLNAILSTVHSLSTLDIRIAFLWVPSHTGIRGNDLADKAAALATTSGTPVNLGLSPSEIRAKIKTHFIRKRKQYLKTRCENHGWVFEPDFKQRIPFHFPRRNQSILNRILTISYRHRFVRYFCPCGCVVSLQHLINDCPSLPQLHAVRELRRWERLKTDDFLRPHPLLGLVPMRLLSEALSHSAIRPWF